MVHEFKWKFCVPFFQGSVIFVLIQHFHATQNRENRFNLEIHSICVIPPFLLKYKSLDLKMESRMPKLCIKSLKDINTPWLLNNGCKQNLGLHIEIF